MDESLPAILVVDDIPANIAVLVEALTPGFRILVALNGADALRIVAEQHLDLVLLDVLMPDMDGFEVLRKMREAPAPATPPVIFVTALGEASEQASGLSLGAVDYITKPFNAELVRLRVRIHLELKRQQDLLIRRNRELEDALARVRRLEGIVTICSYCKKIRNDAASWQHLESYLSDHTDALFSHGMCPECFAREMALLEKQ